MAKRKQYPLRIDSEVWAGIERWAADDLRSVNAQVEFIPVSYTHLTLPTT